MSEPTPAWLIEMQRRINELTEDLARGVWRIRLTNPTKPAESRQEATE